MDEIQQLKQITELAGPGYSKMKRSGGKKAYFATDGEITDDVLRAHLNGTQPIGVNMHIGDDKSYLAVFDLDDHDSRYEPSVMRKRAGFIAAALNNMGTPYFVVRSGGGRGYHLWVAFENAARMDTIRSRMRDVLDAANRILSQSPWAHEKFVPDDGQGKGMFHDTGKIWQRVPLPDKPDITTVEHYVELLPKGGKRPVVALPLALESVVLTPREIDETGAMQFHEGGEIVLRKAQPRKSGPKGGQRTKAIDVDAALLAFIKARPGGGYKEWSDAGFNIFGAFGEDGREHWLTYSKETDGFVSEKDVLKKWADIAKSGKCGSAPFWAYARAGGYSGGLPDDVHLDRKGDQTKVILDDVVGSLKLFRDPDGTAYARVGPRRIMRIDSIEFADWLRRTAYASGVTPSQEQINLVVGIARAHAYETVEDVHLRVARKGDRIYVDLCDADDRVLAISADDIELIEGDTECAVVFRRSRQLPIALADGSLEDIRSMVNMDDDQFVVFMACAVKMFFPDTPSPIVNLIGEYGSAKTSTTRVLRSLIDPVSAMVAPGGEKPDDVLIRAWHNYVLTLENMSDLTKLSDTLCGITTGMGFEVRQLFTNGDLFSIWVRRPVIVNGIDPSKYAADLISRMVEIELEKPEKRMLESEFEQRLFETAPRMFMGAVGLVVEVLKLLPKIDPHEFADNVRLAEFGAIGEATARVLGKEPGWFIAMMVEAQDIAQDEAADDSTTMQALNAMQEPIIRRGKFWGTPQELLGEMHQSAEAFGINSGRLPQTAATLSRELNQLKPSLRKRGWQIDKKSRKWLLIPPPEATAEELTAMVS
ncbi:PriCT-2 domain-containing protein [Cognatishimia sp. SS12]|uniref:TOTE conflict system archaeo-eukaryotic primase domain-containing protein n=1 Tax=Cognatishimia sp. SS12 TaxID=2979465 RepID=UPI00232B5FC8|nr:PriCT-2 domain-containing protein [Cognatishimia sp. SS12]MDC0739390.1 PriCT-2 domain-containing protein [Cognatishimia sp. SS12]